MYGQDCPLSSFKKAQDTQGELVLTLTERGWMVGGTVYGDHLLLPR